MELLLIDQNKIATTACGGQEPFSLMVLGDEMEPEFVHGAVITIDPSHQIISGVFVIAEFNDQIYFRQLQIEQQQVLVALNPEQAIKLGPDFIVKGVVVQSYLNHIITHYQYPQANTFTKSSKNRRQAKYNIH